MGAIRTPSSSRAPAGTSSSSPPTRTLNASYMESAEVVSTAKRKRAADDGLEAVKSAKRKKNVATATSGLVDVVNLTGGSSPVDTTTTATPKKRKSKSTTSPGAQLPERRARVFRKHPPRSYLEKLARATSQRMYVIGRMRGGSEECPEERVDIVGTTGNIYHVFVGKEPTCTCPDARKGNQCKHIIYVLVNVLKAPEHLQYQLAFLTSELREIFQRAPINPKDNASSDDNSSKRKPIEGDCPICFMEFDPKTEDIVWCKAACGNNVHKTCFQRWAETQRASGVRCVYCRSPWQSDENELNLERLLREGQVNEEGYVNVAAQLGLSGERDYSTYYQPWVRRRFYYYG
ncbi:RING finger domain protein [Thermoascus aurantiacus ATCC 26904]